MDSSILNSDRCGSVADQTLETSLKLPNLDMKCYLADRTDRKINLYTKRTASQSKRCFHKMEKRTSTLLVPAIDDCFSETSSPRAEVERAREERAKDDLELGLNCGYLDSDVMPRKCITPVPVGFIRGMVERFDSQSQTLGRELNKTVGKTSHEGTQNVTKNCVDCLQSTENTCLAVSCNKKENTSQRPRSKSENVAEHSKKRVHHSRSVKPATAPKPKSHLKSKLVDYKAEDLELNGSALTESNVVQNCCTEIANSCDSENVNNSTADASSLTYSSSLLSSDDKNQIPAVTCVSDCDLRKLTECNKDNGFASNGGKLSTTVTDVDILSGASYSGSSLETDDGDWEDIEASDSIQKQVKKKKTQRTARSNSSSSSTKKLVLKNSLSQKVTRVHSSRDGPSQMKVIYVNETESEKDQAPVVISSSEHLVSGIASGAELDQVLVESMRDSPQAEEPTSAVSEQQLSMTNDIGPSDISGSYPSRGLAESDSDELLYEILPVRFNQEPVECSNHSSLIYEISPIRKNLEDSTPQLVPNDTSAVHPEATDVSANVPLVPARSTVHPDRPSPCASPTPTPAPRKISKGHIDVNKLTQVVLPPSPAPNLSLGSSPTPPMMIPRVPPRVGTSQSVHTPSTPVPLVLPRKRSDVQTVHHMKSRRLPPPPIPPLVPESSPPATDVPAVPQRGIRHQSPVPAERNAASRSGGKRPSIGALRGYEAKCVEVDSGKPSKLNSKSAFSSRSMNDLLKTEHNRGSTLSLHVPPPSEDDIEGNGPVSPSRSEGYLKQSSDGYLPMGSQRSSTISSQFSSPSESLEQNLAGASDGVPGVPPRHTQFRVSTASSQDMLYSRTNNLEKLVKRDNSYLDLAPDEDYDKYAYLSLYAESAPYQIYHQTAVVRQVIEQNMDSESDYDNYYSPQEYVEHAKLCVNDILNRDSGKEQLDSKKLIRGLSTLESAARLGSGFRKLWCEMPKVKESGLLDHMILEERRLQESLFEILSSEASYLKSLNLLVGHFMGMLAIDIEDKDKHLVLTRQDFNWLFSNAKAVRDACIKMLEALEDLWQEGCVINPLRLCSTITEVAQEHYGVYVTYCSNAIYQERKLKELNEKSPEFRYTVRHLEDSADCHSLPLYSFLALPMQRITRMPLLITAMCRYLKPDDASSPEVTRCIQTLQKVVKHCNEGARKMSNLEQMSKIEKVLDFRSVKKIPLISQSRFLVKKGSLVHVINQPSGFLKKSKRTLFFFLFNDLLVITKKKSEKQYEVLEYCSRSRIHTEPITDENVSKFLPCGAPGGCRNLFNMVLIDKVVEFVLSCESQTEQQRWIQAVTPVEHTAGEEVIYMDWDCPQVQAVMQYVATEPDELSLEESDIVNVLRKENDGWYEGERIRDGERGWYPVHCTVEIQNEHVRARNLRQQYQLMKKSGSTLSVMS